MRTPLHARRLVAPRGGCPLVLIAMLMAPAGYGQSSNEIGIHLEGRAVQGGLLIGRIESGAKVRVDGREVRVSPEGIFIVGFDRDANATTVVEAMPKNGVRLRRTVEVQPRRYRIERVDGLPSRKVTPDPREVARIEREAELVNAARRRDDGRTDFLTGFEWPAMGRISGVYGSQRILNGEPRRPHYGVDIVAPVGSKVRAPADGVISFAHPDLFLSGGTVILDHGHGLSSTFLHLGKLEAAVGDRLERGDIIGEVGATGRATGPHLDWRINWFEQRLDPAFLVPPMP